MTNTVPVPVALLTELAKAASTAERSALASQAFDLLPQPRTFLIAVAPDGMPIGGGPGHWSSWAEEVLAGPDLMTLIEEVVQVHDRAHPMADPIAESGLIERLRRALEGAASD